MVFTHLYFYIILGALVAFFPQDALLFPRWIEAQIKLHYINIKCFLTCYFMHRKLAKEMKSLGWPAPPFKFIPIWKRENG